MKLLYSLFFGLLIHSGQGLIDWWEDASLYQIYPRSFKDSNGDGVGDLNGITNNMAYLKEIGITATWLSPIFSSPMADFGYDISNFTEIDPIFGTMDDFETMIAKAKQIGIKIILDFVPNHSSDLCIWFQKSINREDGYDDFYVWDDGLVDPNNETNRLPPSNWVSVFSGPAWTWNEKRQQFYYHQFLNKQPDLNFRNQMVRDTMIQVLKFWLDRGVDGFRIDAVPHIFEKIESNGTYLDEPLSGWNDNPTSYDYLNHIYTKDQPEVIELLYEWREFLDGYKSQNGGNTRILLAEAYSPIEVLDKYVSNGTHFGTQIPFNFNIMGLNGQSTAEDVVSDINNWMNVMWTKHKTANWVLGNHDNPRISNRFGANKVDLMNIILAGLPGATVTYYGEEIGMSNVDTPCTNVSCDNRDPERTPFQWNEQLSAGFSSNEHPWLPVADDYKDVNVKKQRGVSRSHLNIFKGIQKLKATEAFKAFKEVDNSWSYGALTKQILQITRSGSKELYLILVNMGNEIESYEFSGEERNMTYYLINDHSPHFIGKQIRLGRIRLLPLEAVVLLQKLSTRDFETNVLNYLPEVIHV